MSARQAILIVLSGWLIASVVGNASIYWISPRFGSLVGGTTVNIHGTNFDNDFYTTYSVIILGNIPCIINHYRSSSKRLQCVTQPYPGAEEGHTYPYLQARLLTNNVATLTSNSVSRFTYHWSYTPRIQSVLPKSGPVFGTIDMGGSAIPNDPTRFESVQLGASVCETRDLSTNEHYPVFWQSSLLHVRCRSTEQRAGSVNASMIISGHRGRTWNHSQSLYPMHDWSLGMYEIYPDIHTISPNVGSVLGGALVTVTGTGFAVDQLGDVSVDINGIPCQVVSGNNTVIQCVAGAPANGSAAIADDNMAYPQTQGGFRFRGSRGVKYSQYNDIAGPSVATLHSSSKYPDNPDQQSVYPAFGTSPTQLSREDSYGARLEAFFNPHSSGNHTFYVTNDDGAEAFFSQGNQLPTTRIIASTSATGFSNFFRYNRQKSELFDLDRDQDYLLVAEFKEGGGQDYIQVGVHIQDNPDFTFQQTRQVLREIQEVELWSAGLHEVQTVEVSMDSSAIGASETTPSIIVSWGGRQTSLLPLQSLSNLNAQVLGLFDGQCSDAFGLELGYDHFTEVYQFEGDSDISQRWTAWDGSAPVITTQDSLCGRHSLYLPDGRGRAPYPTTQNSLRVSDYPYLCLGYRLPQGRSMAIALQIRNIWYIVSFSGSSPAHLTLLDSFWSDSTENGAIDDDRWHYACTNLNEMLKRTLRLSEDPEASSDSTPSHVIDTLAVYSDLDSLGRGFYVDELSFSIENRFFDMEQYQPPARPNGVPVHSVEITTTHTSMGTANVSSYALTFVPAVCDASLPLLNVALADNSSATGVSVSVSQTRAASESVSGYYTLSLEGQSTMAISSDADSQEIEAALESMEGIDDVTVYNLQRLPQDTLGQFCPGRKYEVRFESSGRNLPLMEAASVNLTGDQLRLTVTERVAGGLFLRPIPGHMLQTPEVTPQVHMHIRGQLAACSGGGASEVYSNIPSSQFRDFCSFKYGPAGTPRVTSVDASTYSVGSIVTLTGNGFSEVLSENRVLFGEVECMVTASSIMSLTCSLGRGFAGLKQLHLHVLYSGIAQVDGMNINYQVALTGVTPQSGSQGGGTELNITGSSFYYPGADQRPTIYPASLGGGTSLSMRAPSECTGGWRNRVLLGGAECEIVASSATSLMVRTPSEASITGAAVASHDIQVSVECQSDASQSSTMAILTSVFTYDGTLTPTVTVVSPATGSIVGGLLVTVTGTGFSAVVGENRIMFGGVDCEVTMASTTELQCSTPGHSELQVAVEVAVAGKGLAVGDVQFTYIQPTVSTLSHCSGSFFGGQVLTVSGTGFGMDPSSVRVELNGQECAVSSVEDTSVVCSTPPASNMHYINNNATNPDYGLGYSWNPSALMVRVGDTVEWSWTGTQFTTRRSVVQVSGSEDTAYDGRGFRSDASITGVFRHTFSKPGTYYYISDGHAHIGFRGTVTVLALEDVAASINISFGRNSIPVQISASSITCSDSGGSTFQSYMYSTAAIPTLSSVVPRRAAPGDSVTLELVGISSSVSDNLFSFGNSMAGCSSATPPLLPAVVAPPTGMSNAGMYGSYTISCTVPTTLPSGVYRPLLHVTGRGWGYSSVEDTVMHIHPRITGSPSASAGSVQGGIKIELQTQGLVRSDIGRTRISIGSSPCVVQDIDGSGLLTCLTTPAVNDGYLSLIERQSPLAHWPLQADFHSSVNNSVVSMDGGSFFRSFGSLSVLANTSVHGIVRGHQEGVSGNSQTDQSILFLTSAFLRAPARQEFASPDGFSMEFWVKIPSAAPPQYRVVVNASDTCTSGSPCGFLVLLNPCNGLEFWVAGGELDNGSFAECPLVQGDLTLCQSNCTGSLDSTSLALLPQGQWQVIRSASTDTATWTHVYVSWYAVGDVDGGVQELSVNGDSFSTASTYFTPSSRPMELGGCSVLPLGSSATRHGLAPFTGNLDEVVYYSSPLSEAEIRSHVTYGTGDQQPLWLSIEGIDSVGDGSPPNIQFPPSPPEVQEVVVDWDATNNLMHSYETSIRLVLEWTGFHGVRQVSRSVFDSCDLESNQTIHQWSDSMQGGRVIIPLQPGAVYYFIDSVDRACSLGKKLQVVSGDVRNINWQVGVHNDITIPEGVGLLFQWSGTNHDLLEMASPVSNECTFVTNNAEELGQLRRGWLTEPTLSGEVLVSGLSVGEHHFACSVDDHCQLGMRFTVTVERNSSHQQSSLVQTRNPTHRVQWLIQDYEDLVITEGDSLEFAWGGFHSLHQVTEDVYSSCDSSLAPLHVWRDSSVDQTVAIEHLMAGSYYFLCSVAGHCSAGMKIKVIVRPSRGIGSLVHPIHADCGESAVCSFAYSFDSAHTPRLSSVTPSEAVVGTMLTISGVGLTPPSTTPGNVVDNVLVWLGQSLCTIGSVTESRIICTIRDYYSGVHDVRIYVRNKGWASSSGSPTTYLQMPSEVPVVTVRATVSSILPQAGSVLGGTEIAIAGTGFSHIMTRNTVQLGGIPCTVISSSRNELRCITGSLPLPTTVDVVHNVEVAVGGLSVTMTGTQFTYSTELTPVISSIDTVNITVDNSITISGMFIDNDTDILVTLVPMLSNSFPDTAGRECTVVRDSMSSTEVRCMVPVNLAAGMYLVRLMVSGVGVARPEPPAAASLELLLEFNSFSPTQAGNGGGTILVLRGMGFPSKNDSIGNMLQVTVCAISCSVLSSNFTELTCQLPSSPASPDTDQDCDVVVTSNSVAATGTESFSYLASLTPSFSSVSPSMGGTAGGTMVAISGSGFFPPGVTSSAALAAGDLQVAIDGAVCSWDGFVVTDSVINCRTGPHRTTLLASVSVLVRGKGMAVPTPTEGVIFEYVDFWSSRFTWGNADPPADGDSVYIRPGQTVYLDVSTPVLNLVLVEGTLVFYDEQDLHFQAKYIFINNGTFQVGTEEAPFQHRAVITLHGNISDPEIPIYGAKVLGVRQGRLDLHGRPRSVTWTRLSQTARANGTSLALQQSVDWVPGDRLVLAPTGKNGNETEEVEVLSVSGDGRMVELTEPIRFTHHGITESLGAGHTIEIRAEVGLLSHNVVVEGALQSDPQGILGQGADQYGAQIFIHRMGPNVAPVKIEYIEVRNSGQAFRLGRYSIHFHLSGEMNGSYVRYCSIHHSFNRAITAHGVHQLLIEGNVAYDIMGHTYFVEDGIETDNRYLFNLGVLTRGSSSLLNTDQLPATFWITNPQNTFIGNAAAASRAYGFWYDLDDNPSGASFTRSVCPNKSPFGEFFNNTAHTCNEFGLRIWERYFPYVDGCGATEMGVATLRDFTGYGNGIHGVELSVVGHVRLVDFKLADNVQNGIEIQETIGDWGGAMIRDTVIASHTSVNEGAPQTGGVKTPNTPRLTLDNVTFVNFDSSSTSCLRACSHCKVRQGGFQVHFRQISFLGGSREHKTAFQWEFEVLYVDMDGSLTDQPGGGWVMPNSPLVPPQHCRSSIPEFSGNHSSHNGTVCSAAVNFLRVSWNQAQPLVTLQTNVNVTNEFGATVVPWRHYRLTHMDGYMMTVPHGYQHELAWVLPPRSRVDPASYRAGVYGVWPNSTLWITHPLLMLPDHVNVGGNTIGTSHGSDPLPEDENFSWSIDNETSVVTYLISGRNLTGPDNNITYTYSYEPCPPDGCPPPTIDYGPYESIQRRWSDNNSWPDRRLPVEGEDVTISSSWRMLVDISPPSLGRIFVYGELMFRDNQDYNFTASLILIQGPNSRMIAGTEGSPFTHNLIVTLTGRRTDLPLVLPGRVILGSKAIGVFGNLSVHGVRRSHTWTRLTASARAGQHVLQLPRAHVADWRAGDQLVVAPSGYDPGESEVQTIASISAGSVMLEEPLLHDHMVHRFLDPSDLTMADPANPGMATPAWWGDGGDLAPEVGLLTRNIVIQGGEDAAESLETHHYGCRILVSQYSSRSYTYSGNLWMDSVEVRHCGQGGYFSHHDPRYSIAFRNNFGRSSGSYVRRSSIHHGYNTALGIHTSNGVELSRNVIWRTTDSSIKCGGMANVITGNLAMLTTTVQPNRPPDFHAVDFPATYAVDGGNVLRNNAAAGSTRLAFQYGGEPCLEDGTSPTGDQAMFWSNTAHSGLVGLNVLGVPQDCTSVGGFTAMFQWNYAVFSSTASSLSVSHLKVAVGKVGLNLNVFGPDPVAHLLDDKFISIADSLIVGTIPGETCSVQAPGFRVRGGVSFLANDHKLGIMMSSFNQRRSKMDGTIPWHLLKGYPTVNGVTTASRVAFARFTQDHNCNYGIYAVGNNPLNPDAVHPLHLMATSKFNVTLESLAFFYEPNPAWIVQEDCVDMDCDGPKHALIRDIDGRFTSSFPTQGSIVPVAELRFFNYLSRLPVTWLAAEGPQNGMVLATPQQVVENEGIARGHDGDLTAVSGGCVYVRAWQGYQCAGLQHHMLVIESLDGDSETRRLSPLALDGGNTGFGNYTDLLNGPMDHGWCTYYTCLKRLSTFFSLVVAGSDYCVWMTGSPPSSLRFHLLNASPDDHVRLCMWFKTTQRKDVYKNGIFIEPKNTRYYDNGAIQQTDGKFFPNSSDVGGANYFDRESQIMHLIVKGSDVVEIQTPPVVQISLSVSVSLDEFFNVGKLIENIAFALGIDFNRIRVVRIVSESSSPQRFRRSLLQASVAPDNSTTNVTLEFGDPPTPNITITPPPTVEEEIEMSREVNDSVDVIENSVPEAPPNGTNPLNEDAPSSEQGFIGQFNNEAFQYIEQASGYQLEVQQVTAVNELGEQLVNLVLTGEIENVTNATITHLSVTPATPPPAPQPPIIPPDFQNVTSDPDLVNVEDHAPDIPNLVVNGSEDGSIEFVFPRSMSVSKEPEEEVGHLVHVQVTIWDEGGSPVSTLGLVTPWMCQASLSLDQQQDANSPTLEGVTSVPFVGGVADFTRLRVNRPSENLVLTFRTIPDRFRAETSVLFSVVAPPSDTKREKVGFVLRGDVGSLPSASEVLNAIRQELGRRLDVDVSRIFDLSYEVSSAGLVVELYLLEKHGTDPPDVPTLVRAIETLQARIMAGTLQVSIGNNVYTAQEDSFSFVTPPPPPKVPQLPVYAIVVISVSSAVGLVLLLLALLACYKCVGRTDKDRKTRTKVAPENKEPTAPGIPLAIRPHGMQGNHDCWSVPSETSFSDASWASLMSDSTPPLTPSPNRQEQLTTMVHTRLQPHSSSGLKRSKKAARGQNKKHAGGNKQTGGAARPDESRRLSSHVQPTVPANFHSHHPDFEAPRYSQQTNPLQPRVSIAHMANPMRQDLQQPSRRDPSYRSPRK